MILCARVAVNGCKKCDLKLCHADNDDVWRRITLKWSTKSILPIWEYGKCFVSESFGNGKKLTGTSRLWVLKLKYYLIHLKDWASLYYRSFLQLFIQRNLVCTPQETLSSPFLCFVLKNIELIKFPSRRRPQLLTPIYSTDYDERLTPTNILLLNDADEGLSPIN